MNANQARWHLQRNVLTQARLNGALIAIERGIEPRIVKTEAERLRLQLSDKSGHKWRIGEQYYAVEDLLKSRK